MLVTDLPKGAAIKAHPAAYIRLPPLPACLRASSESAPSTPIPFVLFASMVTGDDACGWALGRGYESGLEAVFGAVAVVV